MKNSLKIWKSVIAICAILVVLAVAPVPRAYAGDPVLGDPGVVPPQENAAGMTYGDWSAAWWQYALTFTNDVSPILDSTGARCGLGQSSGPVFFLAGSGGGPVTRTCTIPAGKTLVVPIINFECSTVEPPPFHGDNEQELRTCAALWADGVGVSSLKFTIDHKKVNDLGRFRVQSPLFEFIEPPDNNFLGLPGVTSGVAVSDGYWVVVKPLSPGFHVIHFEGAIVSGPGAGGSQNATYRLFVTP